MVPTSKRSGIHHHYQPSVRTLGEFQFNYFNQNAGMQQQQQREEEQEEQQQFQEAMEEMWSPPVTPYNHSYSTAGTVGFPVQQRYAQTGSCQKTVDEWTSTRTINFSKTLEDARQLEKNIDNLILERDKHEKDSVRAKRQLENSRKECGHLQRQVYDLRLQLSEGNPNLKRQIATLEDQKRELMEANEKKYYEGQMSWMCTQNAQNEWVVLFQQVEKYKEEAAKWKQEALGKGSEAVNTAWQASVDEAVEKKREQDDLGWKLAIRLLQEENAALRAEKRK